MLVQLADDRWGHHEATWSREGQCPPGIVQTPEVHQDVGVNNDDLRCRSGRHAGSACLETVVGELQRAAVLGDCSHDVVGHSATYFSLNLERDADLGAHKSG